MVIKTCRCCKKEFDGYNSSAYCDNCGVPKKYHGDWKNGYWYHLLQLEASDLCALIAVKKQNCKHQRGEELLKTRTQLKMITDVYNLLRKVHESTKKSE